MWRAILSIPLCFIFLSTALPTDAADKKETNSGKSVVNESQAVQVESKEKAKYHSWIENDLLPATREILKSRPFFPCWCSGVVEMTSPRPYVAIEPYAEASLSTKLQFSAKSLLAPTQVLFEKDRRNTFRSAFAPSGWDEQENQELAEIDETSSSIEMAFPQSKQMVRCSNSNESEWTFGSLKFNR